MVFFNMFDKVADFSIACFDEEEFFFSCLYFSFPPIITLHIVESIDTLSEFFPENRHDKLFQLFWFVWIAGDNNFHKSASV